MKKALALFVAVMMALALAACGGKGEKPSGNIADIGGGGAQQSSQQPDSSQTAPPTETGDSVEIKGDTIIHKTNDGMGTASVSEYIFKDGALSEINTTLTYGDKATAQMVYDQMKNGELKDTAAATYKSFKLEGNKILCEMAEDYAAVFAGFSQEQMVALLEGGDPFAGGGTIGGAPSSGGTAGGETLINTSWNDLTLPEGFPKLAEGVTNYSNLDSLITMSWNTMPKSDAEAMLGKLESWADASAEKMEMDGTISWHLDNGSCTIDLNYYADTIGGAMDQVMLSVMIFE